MENVGNPAHNVSLTTGSVTSILGELPTERASSSRRRFAVRSAAVLYDVELSALDELSLELTRDEYAAFLAWAGRLFPHHDLTNREIVRALLDTWRDDRGQRA